MYFSAGGQDSKSSDNMRRLKGIGIEELGYAFLAIVFILVVGYIVIAAYGGLPGGELFTCEPEPPAWKFWCQAITADVDYQVAKQSTDALVCAINSVALGSPQPCVQKAALPSSAQPTATVKCEGAEMCCASYIQPTSVIYMWATTCQKPADESACGPKLVEDTICCEITYKPRAFYRWENKCTEPQTEVDSNICTFFLSYKEGVCCEHVLPLYFWASTCPTDTTTVSADKCYGIPPLTCEVKNYALPQKFEGIFSKPEEWIAGFGDPKFLTYFQSFPQGEDAAWSSMSEWYQGVGTIAFASMCLSRVLSPIIKTLKILKPTRLADVLAKAPSALKSSVQSTMDWMSDMMNKVSKAAAEGKIVTQRLPDGTYITQQTGKPAILALKDVIKEESIEWFTNNWKPAMARAAKYMGLTGTAAYAAARIDSEIGKFIDINPSSLDLGQALGKRESHELNIKINPDNDKPLGASKYILLAKDYYFFDSYAPFYLVSPCYANLTITQTDVLCDGYTYDPSTEHVQCNNVVGTDRRMETKQCGFIKLHDVEKKKVFYDENGNGRIDKINITVHAVNFIIQDLDEDNTWEICSEKDSEKTCLTDQFETAENPNNFTNTTIKPKQGTEPFLAYLIDADLNGKIDGVDIQTSTQIGMKATAMEKLGYEIAPYFNPYLSYLYLDIDEDGILDYVYQAEPYEDGFWQSYGGAANIDLKNWGAARIWKDADKKVYYEFVGECWTPAVTIKVIKDESISPNFCYGKESFSDILIMSGSFVINAFAKRIPSPLTWLSATAADCSLAYLSAKAEKDWPGS